MNSEYDRAAAAAAIMSGLLSGNPELSLRQAAIKAARGADFLETALSGGDIPEDPEETPEV